jgi:hypothetical protein
LWNTIFCPETPNKISMESNCSSNLYGTEFNGNHDQETFIFFTKRRVFLAEVAVNLVSIIEGFKNSQLTAAECKERLGSKV